MTQQSRQETSPLLLTPGPLTTAVDVRSAMLRDWGSRELDFIALTTHVREKLLAVIGAADEYTAIPIQGSGTFAVEAMLGTFVPKAGKVLILINGSYGRRMLSICARLGRPAEFLEWPEDQAVEAEKVSSVLAQDSSITHVVVVHVETTTGLCNPIEEVAEVVKLHQRSLLIDAMASFGAMPLNLSLLRADAAAASSNKCLEGTPGIGIVLGRIEALAKTEGQAPSLSLDLHDQWRIFESTNQWRFTPPVQVVAALNAALDLLKDEGGPSRRLARYQENCNIVLEGFKGLDLKPFLKPELQAPIITTFHSPTYARYRFDEFHAALLSKGFSIYPGKLTQRDSFRVGCIGQIFPVDMRRFIAAATAVLEGFR